MVHLFPYVLKPSIWPEIWRRGQRVLYRKKRDTWSNPALKAQAKQAGQAWCESLVVRESEALRELGLSGELVSVAHRFEKVFEEAHSLVKECPMKLGGAANMDWIYTLCEQIKAATVVETGVAYGWSSLVILLSLHNRNGGRLWSVDLPYLRYRNDRWVGVAVPSYLQKGWKIYRMADREGLPRALCDAGPVDLAHYDSDKSPEGRLFAYRLLWEALRPGGLLISDDVGDNLAFKDFCHEVGHSPVIVRFKAKYQGTLRKNVNKDLPSSIPT